MPAAAGAPAVRLRRAVLADAPALASLDTRCFPVGDRFPRRVWRHLLGAAAARGSALTVLAVAADGAVVGSACVLLRRTSRVIRLYTLAVDPAARGQGLAGRLLAALLARCPRRCATVSLEVRTGNPARALYERWGFQQVATLPGYYRDGAAGVRLRAPRRTVAAALSAAPAR